MRFFFVLLCVFVAGLAQATSPVQSAGDVSAAVSAHDHAVQAQGDHGGHSGPAGDGDGHSGRETQTAGHGGHPAPAETTAPAMHGGHGAEKMDHAGHEGHGADNALHADHSAENSAEHVHPVSAASDPADITITEKLGQYVAGEARFVDESGQSVTMAEIIDKPTIIVPVYFTCPSVCAIIQSALAAVLPDVKLEPGRDFQIVSISFDETDTPELAANQQRNFMAAMNFTYPEHGWRFLTGDEANIRLFMNSLGFGFRRDGRDFIHPMALMAVSPKGKIVRYLYGTRPLAFDLTMAATEAGKEQVGLSVKRVLAYCFSYDPEGKRYVFNFMKITGTGILIILGVLLAALLLAGRKKRPRRNSDQG